MWIIFLILAIVFFSLWLWTKNNLSKAENRNSTISKDLSNVTTEKEALLKKYADIIDVEKKTAELRKEFASEEATVKQRIALEESAAKQRIAASNETASQILSSANASAEKIISDAEARAKEIAGEAMDAKARAKEYEATSQTLKRIIEGYGDEWLKPSYSLLDELADDFGFTEAGQKLKEARTNSANMVKKELAATCDYAEYNRKVTAIHFVIDAFNGKVDSILSKVKRDNYGVLEQKIKDAFQLVNNNGTAFRKARILPEYLEARLEELKWAVIVHELKAKAAEEQRALREKMREEEKARKEYERAQKETAKEEAMLKKAMEKSKEMLASANEAQKAKYEAQLQDLEAKLKEAEEKNQRAISMAQQTKHGTVYVISNIGAFGENVYKVGMTRRLDPLDRIKELGDASVPFSFDVHAFIESDDAPTLESALHKELSLMRMNKVNPRKEFFRVDIATIKALVEKKNLKANWTIAAEAAEYRETLAIDERIRKDPAERARWESFAESIVSEDLAYLEYAE